MQSPTREEEQLDLLNASGFFDPAVETPSDSADYVETIDMKAELVGFKENFNPPHIEDFEDAPLDDKIAIAVAALMTLLRLGKTIVVCCSFGKDSSVCLALALMALKQAKEEGLKHPRAWVLHSDTGIENPIISGYAHGEIAKLRSYIAENDLNMGVYVAKPNFTNNYLVQMIGGRVTASLPGMDAKCQSMLKAVPLESAKKAIKKIFANEKGISARQVPDDQFVSIIGNRFDESNARAQKMRERGESATIPTFVEKNGGKNWVLSAIADWSAMDVFELIGNVTNDRIKTYSDFHDLTRVYRESQGECMVNLYVAGQGEKKTSCSSRFGCWTCARVQDDKSMENLLAHEDYGWLKGLNDIRNYIVANHFNPQMRSWVPRLINKETGTVKLSPNTYSPEFCLELLRYVITQDALEYKRTYGAPRFQHMPIESVIAVDLLNARYGYLTPHRALREYYEIWEEGERYYPPENYEVYPRNRFPTAIEIPFADEHYEDIFAGFRDLQAAMGGEDLFVTNKNGRIFFDANLSDTFDVDVEGANLFYDFEAERIIFKEKKETLEDKLAKNRWHKAREEDFIKDKEPLDYSIQPSTALFTYLRYGTVSISKGAHSEWDRMLRTSNQIWRHRITQDELSDPIAIIKKVAANLILSDEKIDRINEQIQSKNFSEYYQEHYKRSPELMPKRSMTVEEVKDLNKDLPLPVNSSPEDLAYEIKPTAPQMIEIVQLDDDIEEEIELFKVPVKANGKVKRAENQLALF